jgi:hypothetical protein
MDIPIVRATVKTFNTIPSMGREKAIPVFFTNESTKKSPIIWIFCVAKKCSKRYFETWSRTIRKMNMKGNMKYYL